MIAHGDDVLAVWVVAVGPNNSVGQVDSTLRVARFGADGSSSGEVATLAAAHAGQFDRKPLWVDLGDALGLAWSREQEVDTSCTESCLSKGTVEYSVLDAESLTPRGPALELGANGDSTDGITASLLSPDADDLLVTVDRWGQGPFSGGGWSRGGNNPGSATIHCDH